MTEFPHPNMTEFKCPFCRTDMDLPVVLIPIIGTREGDIMKARQVHSHCIEYVIASLLDKVGPHD